MPDNVIRVHNSTFEDNRHALVVRHYDETVDAQGNLRKRYNYTNLIISNCTFTGNDQVMWVNSDPPLPRAVHRRTSNLTIHVRHSVTSDDTLTSSGMYDNALLSEAGFDMYDLVPSVKMGPIGRINVTFHDCIITQNYGG